jgi:hypothetical protein
MDQDYFRGGKDLTPKPKEVQIDPQSGLVQPTRGISLSSDPGQLARFGGAYKVISIPAELEIVRQGKRKTHYELRPRAAMPLDDFIELLKQVQLEDVPTT